MTDGALAPITVDWPSDPSYRSVGRLVLGGVAARLDVAVDRIDELGLALDNLARVHVPEGRLPLRVVVEDIALHATVGPFSSNPVSDPAVLRIVERLVDGVGSSEDAAGHRVSLTLTRGTAAAA